MISAQIVADSKNEFGNRITTMVITFPRIILAEFNTHRMLSRNSASSRAIPFAKMVKSVEENPFIPIAWQKDHKGMQGTEYFKPAQDEHDKNTLEDCLREWQEAKESVIYHAKQLNRLGVTKQLANRLLEVFMLHTVIVTATEWENFFALRCPSYNLFYEQIPMEFRSKKDLIKFTKKVEASEFKNDYDNLTDLDWLKINKGQAEIHMMQLAECMWDTYNESTPRELKAGQWHVPYADKIDEVSVLNAMVNLKQFTDSRTLSNPDGNVDEDIADTVNRGLIKISTVMCARTSYTVVGKDQKPMTYERMIELHDKLVVANPKHMSPFEHCAKTMSARQMEMNKAVRDYKNGDIERDNDKLVWKDNEAVKKGDDPVHVHELGWSGNFRGFLQYRKMIPNENVTL